LGNQQKLMVSGFCSLIPAALDVDPLHGSTAASITH
jgi:hypothetical protein